VGVAGLGQAAAALGVAARIPEWLHSGDH
jgi:hypothetical protein